MDLLLTLGFCFGLLLLSAFRGYPVLYPLLMTLGLLLVALRRRGFSGRALLRMSSMGVRQAFPVISILMLIGAVTATWMAAGTVPAIVYYGVQLIHPAWFVLTAFLLTSTVSLLLGTSFGAAGTIGIALMIMARGSPVDAHVIAGAIIAGAYVGDRCSPMSSSAHLIATLTQTNIYANLNRMVITGLVPFLLACGVYLVLSLGYPVAMTETVLIDELDRWFNLEAIVLLPALGLAILAVFRVNIKLSMLVSTGMAAIVALVAQQQSLGQVLWSVIAGFRLASDSPVQAILLGGGLWAMAKVCAVVIVSTAISGLLEGTRALQGIETQLQRARSRRQIFWGTTAIGLASAAFGCTQTIAILLTHQLVKTKYTEATLTPADLAIDLENTTVVLSPLIPWNIAGLVPATILTSDAGFIPFAVYLYLVPLVVGWGMGRAGAPKQPL